MSRKVIRRGSPLTDGTGDNLAQAYEEINANFAELYRATYKLEAFAVPIGVPSSGTIDANGALVLTTPFYAVYADGIWLSFPANAVYAGAPAGVYWVTMTDTQNGLVYTNSLTQPCGTKGLLPPVNPTLAVGTGAYTQVVGAGLPGNMAVLASATLPGGTLGKNGSLRVWHLWDCNNTAGGKQVGVYVNAISGANGLNGSQTLSGAGTKSMQSVNQLHNMNSETRNLIFPSWGQFGVNSAACTASNVNTAVDTTVIIAAQVAVATDWVVLNHAAIEVAPSNF